MLRCKLNGSALTGGPLSPKRATRSTEEWQPYEWDRQTFEARTDGNQLFVRAKWKWLDCDDVLVFDKDHELHLYMPPVPPKTWRERAADAFSVCVFLLPMAACFSLLYCGFWISLSGHAAGVQSVWALISLVAAFMVLICWSLVIERCLSVF